MPFKQLTGWLTFLRAQEGLAAGEEAAVPLGPEFAQGIHSQQSGRRPSSCPPEATPTPRRQGRAPLFPSVLRRPGGPLMAELKNNGRFALEKAQRSPFSGKCSRTLTLRQACLTPTRTPSTEPPACLQFRADGEGSSGRTSHPSGSGIFAFQTLRHFPRFIQFWRPRDVGLGLAGGARPAARALRGPPGLPSQLPGSTPTPSVKSRTTTVARFREPPRSTPVLSLNLTSPQGRKEFLVPLSMAEDRDLPRALHVSHSHVTTLQFKSSTWLEPPSSLVVLPHWRTTVSSEATSSVPSPLASATAGLSLT
ncbi:uncharacterized protein LOC131516021 isoform X1 [Neofelis nebulosa]|uniref:uncharacterized protein LOC131516021 isoform X1 n=1 Tax=Neofelis nebulosa TaxID=61452 RepID=UPI00272BAC8B|nr:uncharacterized protein LOC131516021 isoform X1 [Neofelis nebulosa]